MSRHKIIDNAKCAIASARAQEPRVRRRYAECAEGYGIKIDACPPHDLQNEGIVESGVKHLKDIFLPLRSILVLACLNVQACAWVSSPRGSLHKWVKFQPAPTHWGDETGMRSDDERGAHSSDRGQPGRGV